MQLRLCLVLLLVFGAALGTPFTAAQEQSVVPAPAAPPLEPSAKDKADLIARAKLLEAALFKSDADTIIHFTHPAIYQIFGSKEDFEKAARGVVQALGGKAKLVGSSYEEPKAMYSAGDQWVCFVPRVSTVIQGEKKVKSTGFLIAARPKKGGEWLFLDSAILLQDPATLQKFFPGLPKDIELPPNKSEELP